MDENDETNQDAEFKRYLKIMGTYLDQLMDENVTELCNSWIQRLSKCKEEEKKLRNKYVFALCYQLARGILEEPFIKHPDENALKPIMDDISNDDTSTEIEYIVINPEDDTKVIFGPKNTLLSDNEYNSNNELTDFDSGKSSFDKSKSKTINRIKDGNYKKQQTVVCYACPYTTKDYKNQTAPEDDYKLRTNNLIMKLRQIKTQNTKLYDELSALKEESKNKSGAEDFTDESLIRVDNATSALLQLNCDSKIKTLKCKLKEAQSSRNLLIQTIEVLQEKLDNFDDVKNHEIEDIIAQHKLETINLKSSLKEEMKIIYEKKLVEQRKFYEHKIEEMKADKKSEIHVIDTSKDTIIAEKDKLIIAKDYEISQLNSLVEEHKNNLHSVLSKIAEKPKQDLSSETFRLRAEHLEKRLNKLEKSKIKCIRTYEVKLAQLQREKHLVECSLQLQLARQRAQVINEIADENQTELVTALDKLEIKYKDIVANVQSTAIQRRLQDQIALDSIIRATGKSENIYANYARVQNHSQFSGRTMQNQGRDGNQSYESEVSSVLRGNKVDSGAVNKSAGENSVIAGYCLDGERMGQLFERVCVPQRDTGDTALRL